MSAAPATFRAMGCEVVVAGEGATPAAVAAVRALFTQRERVFSRFLADSELSRVNAASGRIVQLTPLFAATLRRALAAARMTDGLVDPTLCRALVAAGYGPDGLGHPAAAAAPAAPGEELRSRLHELRLGGRLLARPEGLHLDLNGVVKGLAVDDAAALLAGPGFVSAGGDIAVRGPVVVALPAGPGADAAGHELAGLAALGAAAPAVRLVRGGMATSGSAVRRWERDGRVLHHLIDPASGEPADSPWACVTVVAGSCHEADIAAKAAFLAGEGGTAWLERHGLAGRFLRHDGSVVETWLWRALAAAPTDSAPPAARAAVPSATGTPEEAPCT